MASEGDLQGGRWQRSQIQRVWRRMANGEARYYTVKLKLRLAIFFVMAAEAAT
jgi:hypothetical protein